MLASRVGRFYTYPLLVLTWMMAVANLGVSAALVSQFHQEFPTHKLGARTVLICFAATWNTLFGLIFLIGAPISPKLFALKWNFVAFVISFLLFLVGAGSMTEALNGVSCSAVDAPAKCTMFRGLEGISWTQTWLLFFYLGGVSWQYLHQSKEEDKALLKKEQTQA
ncbi:hypothetical protein T439DRAFT_351354 [Meredithblackwellia eburnea MCA 4105]